MTIPAHLPMLDHVLKARAIQKDRAVRMAAAALSTARLLDAGFDADALTELQLLQQAMWSRLAALGTSWMQDWAGWGRYAGQIKSANTMSKFFEVESNILARAAHILGLQVTSLVTLQENFEVDYSYLVDEILAARRKPQ